MLLSFQFVFQSEIVHKSKNSTVYNIYWYWSRLAYHQTRPKQQFKIWQCAEVQTEKEAWILIKDKNLPFCVNMTSKRERKKRYVTVPKACMYLNISHTNTYQLFCFILKIKLFLKDFLYFSEMILILFQKLHGCLQKRNM